MLRVRVGLIALIGLVIACRKQAPPALVLDEAVWIRVVPKVEAAMARPALDGALETLLSGLADDPQLVRAGTMLFAELSADPKITAPLEGLVTKITENPEIQAEIMRLMAEHPEASPEQVGDLVGARFEEVWASKPVGDAWTVAFNRYLSKMRALPQGLAVRALFDDLRVPSIDRPRLERWSKRLEALEGKRLEGSAAHDAYLRHAWSDARIDTFATAIAKNPALQKITARALADLLALPSLRGDLQTAAVTMLSDPTVRDRALAALLVFSLKDPPIARVRIALTDLMTTPALIDASGKLVGRVLENRDVRGIVVRWYDQVRADASIRAEFTAFLDNW